MSSQYKKLPAYCTTSLGPPSLGNIAMRLRDLAAFLAAHGLPDVAEHASRASGELQAYIAYMAVPTHYSRQVTDCWTQSRRQAPQRRLLDAGRGNGEERTGLFETRTRCSEEDESQS